jgi:hypothetical protein
MTAIGIPMTGSKPINPNTKQRIEPSIISILVMGWVAFTL